MLARGDHTPMASLGVLSDVSHDGTRTSPEAMEALGSICVADTVGERVELVASRGQHGRGRLGAIVRLQPRLDRVERILRSISLRSTSAWHSAFSIPLQMSREDCWSSQRPQSCIFWSIAWPVRSSRQPWKRRSGPWAGLECSSHSASRLHAAAYWLSLAVEDRGVFLRQSR